MRQATAILFFLFHAFTTDAQDVIVDREGEDVFYFYQAGKKQLNISSGDPALKFTGNIHWGTKDFYVDADGDNALSTGEGTVTKSHLFYFTGKLTSTEDYLFLSDIGKLKPAVEFKTGYQRSIDEFHGFNRLLGNNLGSYTWGGGISVKLDNTAIYDSVIKGKPNSVLPMTYKAEVNGSIVRFSWIIPSASLSVANTWNKDDLLKYQDNKPKYQDQNVIALGDFIGFIGNLKREWNYRLRLSTVLPIGGFLRPFGDPNDIPFFPYLTLAPYFVYNGSFSGSNSGNLYGMSLSFFSTKLATSSEDFDFSEAFGIGMDYEDNLKGRPRFFIYGTLSIGDLIDGQDEDPKTQRFL